MAGRLLEIHKTHLDQTTKLHELLQQAHEGDDLFLLVSLQIKKRWGNMKWNQIHIYFSFGSFRMLLHLE